jgi:hypothetical protein
MCGYTVSVDVCGSVYLGRIHRNNCWDCPGLLRHDRDRIAREIGTRDHVAFLSRLFERLVLVESCADRLLLRAFYYRSAIALLAAVASNTNKVDPMRRSGVVIGSFRLSLRSTDRIGGMYGTTMPTPIPKKIDRGVR